MAERSDGPEDSGGEEQAPKKPLLSARDARPAGANGRGQVREGRPKGRNEARAGRGGATPQARRDGASKKPTPVRAMALSEAPSSRSEPDAEEVELSIDGADWVARVLGRSGRDRAGATPLLLIGFWPADASTGDARREAFVVGRTLADTPTDMLERAYEGARTVPASDA